MTTDHQHAISDYPDWLMQSIIEDYASRRTRKSAWEVSRIAAIKEEIKRRKKTNP